MKKNINKRKTKTNLNIETGEITQISQEETVYTTDTEPDYIKIYIGTQMALYNLDPSLAPYVVAFGPFFTFANDPNYVHMVQTGITVREFVAQKLGVSVKRVDQIIKSLVDGKVFIPIYREHQEAVKDENGNETGDYIITRKKRRGVYFVNPWVVAKGSWNDIKELRQEINFKDRKTNYLINDANGTRRFTTELPILSEYIDNNGSNKQIPGQISLKLEVNEDE